MDAAPPSKYPTEAPPSPPGNVTGSPSKDASPDNGQPPADVNCFAAILLGIKCQIPGVDKTSQDNNVLDLVNAADSGEGEIDEEGSDVITTVNRDNRRQRRSSQKLNHCDPSVQSAGYYSYQ